MKQYDLVIVGGGLVGASLALALQQTSLNIAIIEAHSPNVRYHEDFDARSIALAYGSQQIFSELGLWASLQSFVEPIERIHISDRGRFGMARLNANQTPYDALGYVIEAQAIASQLYAAIQTQKNLTWYCPARVTAVENNCITVTHDDVTQQLWANLIIAADGM
ncbi:unnamed protein product, partial [marine sediment metagenome]